MLQIPDPLRLANHINILQLDHKFLSALFVWKASPLTHNCFTSIHKVLHCFAQTELLYRLLSTSDDKICGCIKYIIHQLNCHTNPLGKHVHGKQYWKWLCRFIAAAIHNYIILRRKKSTKFISNYNSKEAH